MYYCPIVPIPHLEELGWCRIALVLSHLVGDGNNYYTDFYRSLGQSGTHIILDNGAYEAWLEKKPLPTLEDTLVRAEAVGAHEIQFLEAFWDGRETIQMVHSWSEEMGNEIRKRYLWHAIVQGGDQRDYSYCFEALAEMDTVDIIGIPKVVTPHCFLTACQTQDLAISRIVAVAQLTHRTEKPIHLLGLEDPREVLIQRKWGHRIRSADSSFPIIHAMHGIAYSCDTAEYPTDLSRFNFHSKLPDSVVEQAKENLAVLRKWCGEPDRAYVAEGGSCE